MTIDCVWILCFIALVIVLGTVLHVNYGLLGISFSFLGGCFLLGMSLSELLALWPVKLFFQMFSVTFFYAFAERNGTLELLVRKMIYLSRNASFLIPVFLFLVCALLSGIGPGSMTAFLILIPLLMRVAGQTGLHSIFGALLIAAGVNAGCWSPVSVNGITIRGIMETSGYSAAMSHEYGMRLFRNMFVVSAVIFALGYLFFRGWKCKCDVEERPEQLSGGQRLMTALILALTLMLVVCNAAHGITDNSAVAFLAKNMDISFLAIIFSIFAVIGKAADEKEAFQSVPWNTIIMVCGMGMLVATASEAGVITWLASQVGGTVGTGALPFVILGIAAVMSLFSSTTGVVVPVLFPVVSGLSGITGVSVSVLFTVVVAGAVYAGCSPLSLFGGLIMATVEEHEKNRMFASLIMLAAVCVMLVMALTVCGVIR